MSDPLNSFVNMSDMYNENGNRSSNRKKQIKSEDEEFEADSADESGDDNYIQVKINKTKILGKVNLLEKQNNILQKKLEYATDENLALRENNIKFQVEIFKLRRKIKEMEGDVEQPNPPVFEDEVHKEPEKLERPPPRKSSPQVQKKEIIKRSEPPVKKPKITKSSSSENSSSSDEEESKSPVKSEVDDDWNDIKISKSKMKSLNEIIEGKPGDSKFINKIALYLWDEPTLINSSVTGIPPNNPCQTAYARSPLDPTKLRYLKYLFEKRLDKEKLKGDKKKQRAKRMNALINNKINNLRRPVLMKIAENNKKAEMNLTI